MHRQKSQKGQYICLSYILAFQIRYLIVNEIILHQRNFGKPNFNLKIPQRVSFGTFRADLPDTARFLPSICLSGLSHEAKNFMDSPF